MKEKSLFGCAYCGKLKEKVIFALINPLDATYDFSIRGFEAVLCNRCFDKIKENQALIRKSTVSDKHIENPKARVISHTP